jgi:DNA modification methylase
MPHRIALALQEDGWYVRQDMQWIKRNGLPESVGDRPVVTHEYVFMLTKLPTYHWDAEAVKRPSAQASLDMVAQATFASQSGGDKDSRNHRSSRKALEGFAKNPGARQFRSTDPWLDSLDDEIRQVSERLVHLQAIRDEGGLLLTPDGEPLAIRTVTWPYKGSHFATFPPVLIRDLIRGATSEGGCCPACGKQYERVVEKQKTERGQTERSSDDGYVNGKSTARSLAEKRQAYRRLGREGPPSTRTIGFRPTCDCNAGAPIPPIVCDPFCGTGTVGQVCRELGLRFIGIDLSAEYLARHASIRAEGKTMVAALREAKERLRESYAREPDELEASSDGQLALF